MVVCVKQQKVKGQLIDTFCYSPFIQLMQLIVSLVYLEALYSDLYDIGNSIKGLWTFITNKKVYSELNLLLEATISVYSLSSVSSKDREEVTSPNLEVRTIHRILFAKKQNKRVS